MEARLEAQPQLDEDFWGYVSDSDFDDLPIPSNPIPPSVSISNSSNPINPILHPPNSSSRVCGKKFPKAFCERTHFSNNYPVYRRRDSGREISKRTNGVDMSYNNQWVVGMNVYLSARFNAHINVEVAAKSTKVCRYLYKYLHKGSDKAAFSIRDSDNQDEIKAYSEGKYISAHEADYRIKSRKIYYGSHHPFDLAVHLPDRQMVYYREGQEQEAAIRPQANTHLTAWFTLNQRSAAIFDDPAKAASGDYICTHTYTCSDGVQVATNFELRQDSRAFCYYEIPEHFTFIDVKGGNGYWAPRKRLGDKMIGKLHKVNCSQNPESAERYYLRMLLLNVRGATSFDDLRTVPGRNQGLPFETFREAASALGLLIDDREHENCLEEASQQRSPSSFRYLFIFLLSLGTLRDPKSLYDRYKAFLMEGLDSRFNGFLAEADMECALFLELARLSQLFNFDFNSLPWVIRPSNCPEDMDALIDRIDLESLRVLGQQNFELHMNDDQKAIVTAVESGTHTLIFMHGHAGTGKTFVYNTLYQRLVGAGKKVLCVAYSGIAASLLPKGQTAHSAFKLKLNMTDDDFASTLRMQSKQAQKLRELDFIIWDEISMVPKCALKAVDQLFRDLTGCTDVPFGGKCVIVGGDFGQTLPVVKNGSRVDVINMSVKQYEHWHLFSKFSLSVNVRCADPEYNRFLHSLAAGALGTFSDQQNGEKEIPIDSKFLFPHQYLDSFIDHFFTSEVLESDSLKATTAILAPTNNQVSEINARILRRIKVDDPSHVRWYPSFNEISRDGALHDDFREENLQVENPPGFPPHQLQLKKGAVVMLLRNINIAEGLTNGTRLIVHHLGTRLITCRRLTSVPGAENEYVYIPRIPFIIPSDLTSLEFDFKRTQFPLQLAFAMTINKSQGQSFDRVGIYLQSPVFSHGQLYVAFSRARKADEVRVFRIRDSEDESALVTMKNITWTEALE